MYQGPLSTNVERVTLALAHKGLEAEPVVIDWDDRAPVIEISGQELVPVLDDDGEVVSDSIRILEYLERRYPDPPIYPSEPARRAEMDIFIDWFSDVWKRSPNAIEAEMEGDSHPAAIAADSKLMADRLDLFEGMLTGREYIMGDEVSAADFATFPFLKYALIPLVPEDDEPFHEILDSHQPLGDDHPNLKAWIERLDKLPRA